MNIGVANEQNHFEMRVAITPWVVESLTSHGNKVFVEKGAGEGSKFTDQDYADAGAQIVYSKEEVIKRADMLLMVSPVTPEECGLIREGQIVAAFHHMAVMKRESLEGLLKKKVTTIGYEIIEDDQGELPVLTSMSEIAGQLSILVAGQLLQSINSGRGLLLGHIPGTTPASVVILGGGDVGLSAARMALGIGTQVTIIDSDLKKLKRADELLGKKAMTWLASKNSIDRACKFADVLIGAVLVKGSKSPHLVTEQNVESMKKGSVIIDVSIDQGGCVETSRPTNLDKPTFEKHGVIHYCVPNMPAAVARSATTALSLVTSSYIYEIARLGINEALKRNKSLARGVYTHAGECTKEVLASIFGVKYVDISKLI